MLNENGESLKDKAGLSVIAWLVESLQPTYQVWIKKITTRHVNWTQRFNSSWLECVIGLNVCVFHGLMSSWTIHMLMLLKCSATSAEPFTCWCLACLANLPTGLSILPSVISFFLIADQLSQDPLDRFSWSLHQMIGICLNMTDLDSFWFLKGRCHGHQLKVEKTAFFWTNLLCRTAIPKRIAISQFRYKIK